MHSAQGQRRFVCAMEDVLEVYHRSFDGNEVLCAWTRPASNWSKRPSAPAGAAGMPASYDYEYQRNGVGNLFMLFAPLEGWRRVEVTERRTKADWPGWCSNWWMWTTRIRTHRSGDGQPEHPSPGVVVRGLCARGGDADCPKAGNPLYPQARQLAQHGEIELGVLTRQCLDRRIPCQEILREETQAWQSQRNWDTIRVDWRFTTGDARIKLKSLYPSIQQ